MSAEHWSSVTLSECFDVLQAPVKVQARDYRRTGTIPIVDQGKDLIGGWTDGSNGVVSDLPVVVFGDHTRVFKFVDFPFVKGADGTHLLKPKQGIDPRFFYYRCLALDLSSRGYNRHFSLLREQVVRVPGEAEQFDISRSLRAVEQATMLAQRLSGTLDRLKTAVMRELFTRGLRRAKQKETEIGPLPSAWDVVPLGSLGRIGNGSTPKKTDRRYWEGGTYPWLTSAKVYDREVNSADEFVTQTALDECHLPQLRPGNVLIAITGQGKTLGHCAVLRINATINQHLAYLDTDESVAVPSFVRGYLETQYDALRQVASGGGSTKGALTCAFLRTMKVPLPRKPDGNADLVEQGDIVAVLDAIDKNIDMHKRKRAVLEDLFTSLLHKLMTGEIRVADLNLSALEQQTASV
jgi:restriction endonuclease S subunit